LPFDFTHTPIDAETFLEKLAGGFGRVVLFLQENDAQPFRAAILDSCLHHRAFDRQTESYRIDYLFDIIKATGEPEFYTDHIRRALATEDEEYSYGQLYELAARLALNGDEDARQIIYARFARQAISQDTTGAEEIVSLDGLAGYLFVAAQWQRWSLTEEDHWYESWLLEKLEEQLGKEQAQQSLEQAAQHQPQLGVYLAEVRQKREQEQVRRKERKPVEALTYDELKTRIADPTHTVRWPVWRRYARRLDEATQLRLAQDLLTETDRVPLLKLLYLFREKAFPLTIDRMLVLAQGRDEDLAEAARWALGNLSDERIRALSEQLWADETGIVTAVELLQNNFANGDYPRLAQQLSQEMPADEFHSLGMAVRDLVEAHPSPNASPTLLVLYEHGRCVLCRHRAVELLASLGSLPPWILAEGCYDADTETRSWVEKAAGQPRPALGGGRI
jgi:hypothetical protein